MPTLRLLPSAVSFIHSGDTGFVNVQRQWAINDGRTQEEAYFQTEMPVAGRGGNVKSTTTTHTKPVTKTPKNYIFDKPTKQAYDEAQKVKQVMNKTVKRFDGTEQPLFSKNTNRSISVITHQDGSVSIGISGKNQAQIARLQQELNKLSDAKLPSGKNKYQVGTKTLNSENGIEIGYSPQGIRGNKPGICSEPHCATSAGNNSPMTGSITIWRGNSKDLKNPYTGSSKTKFGDDQMDPCPTCTKPENRQIYHNETIKSQNKNRNYK